MMLSYRFCLSFLIVFLCMFRNGFVENVRFIKKSGFRGFAVPDLFLNCCFSGVFFDLVGGQFIAAVVLFVIAVAFDFDPGDVVLSIHFNEDLP